jgi:hypothetical protein
MRVKITDHAIHAVLNRLFACQEELGQSIGSRTNLITIFFHELAIHFSGILIQRECIIASHTQPAFPYTNRQYSIDPYLYDFSGLQILRKRRTALDLMHRLKVLPVARGEAIPFGYRQDRMTSILVNLLTGYQTPAKGFVSSLKLQFEMLETLIRDLCAEHSISGVDAVIVNWQRYVNFYCSQDRIKVSGERLIIGNRQNLQNRILAHNYIEQGKKVIAFTHGEISSAIFTEPMYDYAERGVCTELVDYGQPQTSHNSRTILPPGRTVYRTSSLASSFFKLSREIPSRKLTTLKILYIPTTYVGDYIYGPSHAYPDDVYAEWHQALHLVFPSAIFKVHPKSKVVRSYPGNTEKRWLDDCIHEYDVYILDYFATSTVRAMLSDKPVIYFDIGLRPLTTEFLRVLKKRCFYRQIDINGDLSEQLMDAFSRYQKSGHCGSNVDVAKYCFPNPGTFSWRDTLFC